MISITLVILLLTIHYLADFVCQTNYMATNKSKSNKALLLHIIVYSLATFVLLASFLDPAALIVYALVNGIFHYFIDFTTSRIASKKYRNNELGSETIPNLGFYSVIGLDQLLHTILIVITAWYIF